MTKSGGGLRVGRKARKQVLVVPAKKQKTYTKGQITVRRALKNTIAPGAFARMGGNLGGMFGPTGAAFGRGVGSVLSSITGMGDYRVKSNSIATSAEAITGEVPHFGKADNSTRVRHREFVSDIQVPATPAAFTNTSYVINPSNKLMFPWLAKFAENYQQYKVHGMVIYFKSTTSDYSAAGAMGKVAMATNYNVRDSDYANMQELENSEFAVSGKPSMSRLHPIECAPNNGVPVVKWVRDTQYDSGSGSDDRLYDVGKFQFATQGLPGTAGTTLGELWVTYDIEFFKPIVGREAAAVQYNPVSLPVFDTLNGKVGPAPLDTYMVEEALWYNDAAFTKEQVWDRLCNPQTYLRAPQTDIASSYLTYSSARQTPDTDNYDWPARWIESPATTTRRKHGVLRLGRPGLWTFVFAVKTKQNTNTTGNAATTLMAGDPVYPLPTAHPANRFGGVTCKYVNYQGQPVTNSGDPYIVNGGCTGGRTASYRAQTSPIGVAGVNYASRDALSWHCTVWLPQTVTDNGVYVDVEFTPPNGFESSTPPAPGPFVWEDGSTPFDATNITAMSFQAQLTNVATKTYYEPVQEGLTKDDNERLADSVNSVMALLPKLRELGISV